MHSCLYSGTVRHRRFTPVSNEFSYNVFMVYLDLDELPECLDRFYGWSSSGPSIAWFRRRDHFGDPQTSLAESVRDEVERQIGRRPLGPIRLLTNLRYFGYVINPVSYYFCFDESGENVECVLAEVHNTPWGEIHCYVLDDPIRKAGDERGAPINEKTFHVSPFMPMDMEYHWLITQPGERLAVQIENHQLAAKTPVDQHRESHDSSAMFESPDSDLSRSDRRAHPFDVTMNLTRREMNQGNLNRILLKHPCMTARVVTAIYWQALRLWWKKSPFYSHPHSHSPAVKLPVRESHACEQTASV
ncbi:MAG: DUF1365 domain-containing protein [Planctomyces sp.]|nr:DUF1365 domain-containing protein [Planctomyces sp.]